MSCEPTTLVTAWNAIAPASSATVPYWPVWEATAPMTDRIHIAPTATSRPPTTFMSVLIDIP